MPCANSFPPHLKSRLWLVPWPCLWPPRHRPMPTGTVTAAGAPAWAGMVAGAGMPVPGDAVGAAAYSSVCRRSTFRRRSTIRHLGIIRRLRPTTRHPTDTATDPVGARATSMRLDVIAFRCHRVEVSLRSGVIASGVKQSPARVGAISRGRLLRFARNDGLGRGIGNNSFGRGNRQRRFGRGIGNDGFGCGICNDGFRHGLEMTELAAGSDRKVHDTRNASNTPTNPAGLSACSQWPAFFNVTKRAAGNKARIAGRSSRRT